MDISTEKIKEIDWTSINSDLENVADYYLKKFEIDKNINIKMLLQFEQATLEQLDGIRIEDYLKTNNCTPKVKEKYYKLLKLKSDFFDKDCKKNMYSEKVPIETYLIQMKNKLKERNQVVQASIDPNQSMEDVENDYSLITDLLGEEDIVIKFK